MDERTPGESGEVYSVPNMITMVRLLMTPVFFTVLVVRGGRYDLIAFAIFAFAAGTDFLDGLVARRTGHVTRLGKALDPLVDRLLIAFAVLGLYVLDRVSVWLVAVLILRDLWLLYGAGVLERRGMRMPVIYLGKVTTALLLGGFSVLMVAGRAPNPRSAFGLPLIGIGTAIVYAAVALSLTTAVIYTVTARRMLYEGSGSRG